jgi:hypothetical protein
VALPEHHEMLGGIGQDMAVDRRRKRLFDSEQPIVKNKIKPAGGPQCTW